MITDELETRFGSKDPRILNSHVGVCFLVLAMGSLLACGNQLYNKSDNGESLSEAASGDANAVLTRNSPTNGDLFNAAARGDEEAVSRLLEFGADPRVQNPEHPFRFSALHYAAVRGQIETAELLLLAGVSADIPDTRGATPLWVASTNGSAEVARLLLNAGASVDAVPDSDENQGSGEAIQYSRPIHRAAREGHSEFVQVLLEFGADPYAQDPSHPYRFTALHYAADGGHTRMAELLLSAGINVDIPDGGGATPLWVASESGTVEVARLLVRAGASVDAVPQNDFDIVAMYLVRRGGPLHNAARGCFEEIVTVLLDAGANPVASFEAPREPERFHPGNVAGCAEVVPLLEGAVDNLSDAVEFGYEHAAKRLLDGGSDPDVLTFALRSHDCPSSLVEMLLDAGADPNFAEAGYWNHSWGDRSSGLTALHFAAETPFACDRFESARMLLDAGADPNAADEYGWTPLHAAVSSICQSRSNNPFNIAGFHPLSTGAALEMMELLLEAGADPNAKFKSPPEGGRGVTPIEIASRGCMLHEGQQAILVDLLEQWGAGRSEESQ